MRKWVMAMALSVCTMLSVIGLAEGTLHIDGQIEAIRTKTISAPFSGMVGDFSVREGDLLEAGKEMFSIGTTPVYADFNGKVTGIFAQPGDSAASVISRYQALCYLEREELYTADCSTSGADSDNEDKIVHVGEVVYLKSSNDKDRTGVARITGVEGRSYTIEVISEKNMRLNEQIKVYRDEDHNSDDCIGSGRLKRIDPVAVTAEGYVNSVHAMDGQYVKRGDLLFEVVSDMLDGMHGSDGIVSIEEDGILLSISVQSGARIEKDAPMATYCEIGDMQLVCSVDEDDLEHIAVGKEAMVTLDAYPNAPLTGHVAKIASASTTQGSANFEVTIELPENDLTRVGMNASVEF